MMGSTSWVSESDDALDDDEDDLDPSESEDSTISPAGLGMVSQK